MAPPSAGRCRRNSRGPARSSTGRHRSYVNDVAAGGKGAGLQIPPASCPTGLLKRKPPGFPPEVLSPRKRFRSEGALDAQLGREVVAAQANRVEVERCRVGNGSRSSAIRESHTSILNAVLQVGVLDFQAD